MMASVVTKIAVPNTVSRVPKVLTITGSLSVIVKAQKDAHPFPVGKSVSCLVL
jgi:hypothetical protein